VPSKALVSAIHLFDPYCCSVEQNAVKAKALAWRKTYCLFARRRRYDEFAPTARSLQRASNLGDARERTLE